MADDRYNWLDKDTAEQLLRGEPVSARHGDGAEELAQLLEAAAAVAARTPETVELPGEEAAVAAFRRAAHGAGAHSAAAGPVVTGGHTARTADRTERTRLGRPIRRGLAVALAACAIGGVAVAAGTGVLPDPFRGGDPAPASSVSADETPGPFRTGEPGAQTDGTTAQTPDATPGGRDTAPPDEKPSPGSSPGAGTTPGSTPGGGTGRDHSTPGGGTLPGQGGQKNFLLALCQNYESGKRDAMDRDTLRRLERKAGGPEKVHVFCRAYLARYQNLGGSGGSDGFVGGAGGDTGGSGQSGGSGGDEDDEGHPSHSPGTTPGSSASAPTPAPSATAPDPGEPTPTATTGG
ncbi:hypothetical protein ACIQU1_12040 [Streptomyces angustmyceticus]|uniref:hypothetical protein n=1 Tax=Streptomyces angustmyceticus TaxID=285578 RepID=UPI00344EA46C